MKYAKQHYILLVLIFSMAFAVRLFPALHGGGLPHSDAQIHDKLALTILEGKGFVNDDGSPHSYAPPFYPFFLSLIYRLFGHSYTAVRIVQSIIGSFSCVLIFLIGKKVYSITAGILSALIFVFYLPFVKSSELLLTESLSIFLLLLIVFYLLRIQESMRNKDCVILGMLLGLALLTKPAVIFLPFFIIPVFIYLRGRRSLQLLKYLLVLLFFSMTVLPWVVRNYIIFHTFIPVSSHGGITFYSSYRPPNGIFGLNATSDDPVIAEANKISSSVLRSEFLINHTLEFILNNPKKVMLLTFKKILYLWAPFDWELVGGRWFNLIYTVMLPFSALGFLSIRRRFKEFYPIILPIIYFQIMTLIFYGSPRFRLPIEPYLFILSVIGMIVGAEYILKKWGVKYEDICSNSGF